MLSIAMNCLWNILFRKIVFEIFCSGKLSLKYFVQENCLWNILSGKLLFVLELWILKYFENFLVKNFCTKCSWLNLRFIDWHLYCSIALSVSLDFCDTISTVWYSLTNLWVDWLIDQLFAWTSWLITIAISFQFVHTWSWTLKFFSNWSWQGFTLTTLFYHWICFWFDWYPSRYLKFTKFTVNLTLISSWTLEFYLHMIKLCWNLKENFFLLVVWNNFEICGKLFWKFY